MTRSDLTAIELSIAGGRWVVADAQAKLEARSKLPGAHAFDRAAHALRLARQRGIPSAELLPLALASSWLVNNPVPSPVFRRWLTAPLAAEWARLLGVLAAGTWLTRSEAERGVFVEAAAAVAIEGHGAGAISKVLALLHPEAVPLMPDLAVAFAIGTPTRTAAALDAQSAPAAVLVPMLDWFGDAVATHDAWLDAVAEAHAAAPLDAAQALDRLLWFDSAGYRHFAATSGSGYWAVKDGARGGVVPAGALTPVPPRGEVIDLAREDLPAAWRAEAKRRLGGP